SPRTAQSATEGRAGDMTQALWRSPEDNVCGSPTLEQEGVKLKLPRRLY
ncbi:mCG63691, partial [Mus musculus]